jgi:antitoxin component YwqK of YwqJK toxin-antitoxin module
MIRYHHQENEFIYEIEIPKNAIHNEDTLECVDNTNAIYTSDRYIIRNVINASTKNVQKGYSLDYCDVLYHCPINYVKKYDRALSEISFDLFVKRKTVFRDDFPNVFRTYYHDGRICEEFYHNKGIVEGIYKSYDFININCECNFVNGKLHGLCKIYDYSDICNACGEENCEWKKEIYEYKYDNGVRLNMDDYFMENELDSYIIPHYLQTK